MTIELYLHVPQSPTESYNILIRPKPAVFSISWTLTLNEFLGSLSKSRYPRSSCPGGRAMSQLFKGTNYFPVRKYILFQQGKDTWSEQPTTCYFYSFLESPIRSHTHEVRQNKTTNKASTQDWCIVCCCLFCSIKYLVTSIIWELIWIA